MRRLCGILVAFVTFALASGAYAIVGGSPDTSHVYAAAVFSEHELCSGAFVSPTVLVTAAHCFPDGSAVDVTFGTVTHPELVFETADASYAGTVHDDPAFTGIGAGNGLPGLDANDIAVVVLDEPVTLPRYAKLPAPGAAAGVTSVDVVGYGFQVAGPKAPLVFGTRQVATTQVRSAGVLGDEFLKLSGAPGTCTGDSGGPNLESGSDLVVAITSFGHTNPNCNGVTFSERLDTAAARSFLSLYVSLPS